MSSGADLNVLDRASSVLPENKRDDIMNDVNLDGHMASLSLNQDQQQQFESPQSQQLQQYQDNKHLYNINKSDKNKNNSDKKPMEAEKAIEFCAVQKLKENDELYDTQRFAMEMVKWGTGANDPESLSEWFKDQIEQIKDLKLKEEEKTLIAADYPKLIQTNCLLQWSIGKSENIW